MLVIIRLWEGCFHREEEENPAGAYLQLHKATELRDLLLFNAIKSWMMHRYEASKGAWGTWCVRWPEETQVPPVSPSRDRLLEYRKDLGY